MLLVLKIASCYIGLNGFSLTSPLKAYYLVGDCTSIKGPFGPTFSKQQFAFLTKNADNSVFGFAFFKKLRF
jgi:hypothetical protein